MKILVGVLAALLCATAALGQAAPSSYTPLAGNCVLYDNPTPAGTTVWLLARGQCNIPGDASAIAVAAFVSGHVLDGELAVFDSGVPNPASSMSYAKKGPASSAVIVRLCFPVLECSGVDLGLKVTASARVVLRVQGYFQPLLPIP